MTRARLTTPALLALLAAACSSPRYTAADYYALLPDLVRFAEADARQNGGPQPPTGPLWLDVKSFAGGGWQLTDETLSRDTVFARIGMPSAQRVEKPQDALMIQDTGTVAATPEAAAGFAGGRWVKSYGVMLHLNQVKADNREIAATITSYVTDRRSWPTGICRRIQRVTYQKDASGAWKRVKNELRKGCDDPD
ncbi:MAG: hypothetical protein ACJ8GN_21620 [Longimicrobiaceae bacterium]